MSLGRLLIHLQLLLGIQASAFLTSLKSVGGCAGMLALGSSNLRRNNQFWEKSGDPLFWKGPVSPCSDLTVWFERAKSNSAPVSMPPFLEADCLHGKGSTHVYMGKRKKSFLRR
ncbi:unnamed protein product [Symbiodinium natans]|uniref:Secreted protein n=1 Tax=Symbiodinium natans TaxID=878477 RepID=A0A812G1L3_9DINO|nr:unnamed protein product [Symbiodinium natans]